MSDLKVLRVRLYRGENTEYLDTYSKLAVDAKISELEADNKGLKFFKKGFRELTELREKLVRKISDLEDCLTSATNQLHKIEVKLETMQADKARLEGQCFQPDIVSFAQDMQYKMEKNKNKPCPIMNPDGEGRSYNKLTPEWCLGRLEEEYQELKEALKLGSPREVQLECADVGNFAMMVHQLINSMAPKAAIQQPVSDNEGKEA